MTTTTLHFTGYLPHTLGKIGMGYVPDDEISRQQLGDTLGSYLPNIDSSKWDQRSDGLILPIGCMDERLRTKIGINEFAVTDPVKIANLQIFQLAGGGVLATAKAIMAADIAAFRDVSSFTGLISEVQDTFDRLQLRNMPHAGCGASGQVEGSIQEQLAPADMRQVITLLSGKDYGNDEFALLNANKLTHLEAGFFEGYNTEWYDQFMQQRNPRLYAELQTAHDDTHGHHAASVILVPDGHVFDQLSLHAATGKDSFALTLGIVKDLAQIFASSPAEQHRLMLAYLDDTVNVSRMLVSAEMPIYGA